MSIGDAHPPSSAPAVHSDSVPAEAAEEATSALHLLKSLKECQERRVAHWAEYNDAFSTYLSQPANPSTSTSGATAPSDSALGTADVAVDAEEAAARTPHSCSHAHAQSSAHANDPNGTIAITDTMLQEILHLVTQGLLECSHRARAIQTELALPHVNQPHLATLVGRIQAKENDLLRATVERDQLRKLAQTQDRDFAQKVAQLEDKIGDLKGEIAEEMQEVAAEMAEL